MKLDRHKLSRANNNIKAEILFSSALAAVTVVTGAILMSNTVSADDSVVDDVNITVPISCNMTGTGNNSHNAEINNGQYKQDIGTTTLKVFCNDNEGFAIYANGYTNQEDGNNVLINSALTNNNTTATGTNTSGDTSNWAMKLTKTGDSGDTTTAPLTIDNSFDDYNTVPTAYTKVAHKNASTDMAATGGATLQSTYAAYINQTQPAGTYSGKVKYVLVHPADAGKPVAAGKVGVTYNANGSSFTGGATKNEVVYATSPMYIATSPQISKTDNIDNNGTQNGSYPTTTSQPTPVPITAAGATKMKIVMRYGFSSGTMMAVMEGNWDGSSEPGKYEMLQGPSAGTETYIFDGDAVTFYMMAQNAPSSTDGQDYGYFAQVYPIYSTEQSGTEATDEFATLTTDTGTYATTTDWYGSWYADINNIHYDFLDETEVKTFLENNVATLSGTTINLYRGLTFNEAYTRASKTEDGGYYKQQELTKNMCNTIAITQNQTLKDTRDGNTYMTGKLKDGNCWMLDNLALDPTDSTTTANMNENNTNATSAAINNLLHGGSTTTGWSSTAVADVDTNFHNGGYTVPRINNASKDTLVTSYGPASTNGQAKVGLYYNYCAASASTYCYEGGEGVDTPDTDIDASQDICPANWRMPTGGSNGEYVKLYNKYSTTMDATSTASLQYNLSTPLSGDYDDSSAYGQGNWGGWWSSTYRDSNDMYDLRVIPTSVNPDRSYSYRYYSDSVRCLVGD